MAKLPPEQLEKRKRINKVIFSVFAVLLLGMIGIYFVANDAKLENTTATKSQTTPSEQSVAQKEQWDMAKAIAMPYVAYEAETDQKANNRTLLDLRIVLAEHTEDGKVLPRAYSDDLGKEQLAATVIAAAKYYAQSTGVDIVSVVLDSQFTQNLYGNSILAHCVYAPDGGGITGDQGWTYNNVSRAQPRGLSTQELLVQKLWGEMRGQYQKDGITDEEALTKAIAEKMGIAPQDVPFALFMDKNFPASFAEKIAPLASLNK